MTTRQRTRAPRRRTMWTRARTEEQVITTNAVGAIVLVNASANVLFTEVTITRIVGSIYMRGTDAGPWEAFPYSMGIVTVTEQANAIGVSALPDPESQEGVDWMYWRASQLSGIGEPTDASSNLYQERIELDLRSQRRLKENNTDCNLIIKNASAFSMTVSVGLNVLLKLP